MQRRVQVYPEVKNSILLAAYCAEKESSHSGLVNELLSEFFKKLSPDERARLIQIGKAMSKNSY